jgi:AhpD family alkylhydroperoxidase
MYPAATPELAARRKELAPAINDAFENFGRAVFAEGALSEKTKQLIAVAVAHVTQCPYCIKGHTRLARRKEASPEEIMDASRSWMRNRNRGRCRRVASAGCGQLGQPCAGWVRGDAEDVDAAGGVLDDEERVQPLQGDGVDMKQVAARIPCAYARRN